MIDKEHVFEIKDLLTSGLYESQMNILSNLSHNKPVCDKDYIIIKCGSWDIVLLKDDDNIQW